MVPQEDKNLNYIERLIQAVFLENLSHYGAIGTCNQHTVFHFLFFFG